jgi:two-component sensor histidine kinase
MDILIALVERAGEVVSQRELINRVWSNVTVDDGNLRFHVGALRRALGDGRDGARYVVNVPGRGYCFVGSTARPPAGGSAPAPIGQTVAVHSLPSRLMRMVGRQTAVEAIAAQLARRRFVTIVGPGGIGKTTVAVAVGHAIAGEYGGACFVDLGPLADPRLIPSLLVTALGLIVQSDNPTRDLIDFLRDKRMLLILDGCEHVIETAARLVESIFDQADGVDVLATSREALRIEGEQVHYLAPLECPPVSDTLTAAESLAFPAAQLFSDRVVATSDRFVLQDGDAPVVARICRKLDGIALAIELAAGRVNAHCETGDHSLGSHRSDTAVSEEHLLVREITHRINNELAAAIGVASLTASRSKNDEVKVALVGVIDVLCNFALVHRALEMPTQVTPLDAAEYLRSLCQCISRSKLSHRGIQLVFVESPVQLSSERCWRLGMIASELIANAQRHAFGDHGGTIRVELSSFGNLVVFRVADDGCFKEPIVPGRGMKIIEALARGLDGEIAQSFGQNGGISTVVFPNCSASRSYYITQ